MPPLDYERAYRLKSAHPDLPIAINGGIRDPGEWTGHLARCDGVMIGREAYQNPETLLQVDPLVFGEPAPLEDAFAMLEALEPFIAAHLAGGGRLHAFTRHLVGLFPGRRGSRMFRRHLAEHCVGAGAGLADLRAAAAHVARDEPETAAADNVQRLEPRAGARPRRGEFRPAELHDDAGRHARPCRAGRGRDRDAGGRACRPAAWLRPCRRGRLNRRFPPAAMRRSA